MFALIAYCEGVRYFHYAFFYLFNRLIEKLLSHINHDLEAFKHF